MVPLRINPIYTKKNVGIYWVYPLLKVSWGVKQLGYHLKGTSLFPIIPGFFTRCSQMIANVSKIGCFLWFCVQKSPEIPWIFTGPITELSDHQESREPTFGGLGLVQKHPKPEEKNHRDLFATLKWEMLVHCRVSRIAPVQLIFWILQLSQGNEVVNACKDLYHHIYIYRTYGI